jgi:hypothetical protein
VGVSGYERVLSQVGDVAANSGVGAAPSCPSGKKVVTIGFDVNDPATRGITITEAYPISDSQWAVSAYNDTATPVGFKIWLVCANFS